MKVQSDLIISDKAVKVRINIMSKCVVENTIIGIKGPKQEVSQDIRRQWRMLWFLL